MSKHRLPKINFIEIKTLSESRFDFVKNDILRENICITMQYVVFLNSFNKDYDLPGALSYSVFKTIIIYTASIIESLINYKLQELIRAKKVKESDLMDKLVTYQCFKKTDYKLSDHETITAGIKKITKAKKLSDETILRDLNIAAKRAGLFDYKLFFEAEKIRKKRNNIHLTGLSDVDDRYTQKDVNDLFRSARKIIDRIEHYEK